MTPGKYDLALYRGDTYSWRFQLWEDDARTDPVDLTGVVAESEIRDKSGGAVIMTLECVVTLPNIIDVELAADLWTGAPPAGAWDLQLTYATGEVRTVVAGKVVITPDITDSVPVVADTRCGIRSA